MIQGYAIAASDVEDGEGRSVAVDVVLRIYYTDLLDQKDLQEVVRHIGGERVGIVIETGIEAKVLSVAERKARKKKGGTDVSEKAD